MRILILSLLAMSAQGAWTKYKLLEPDTGKVVSGPHANFTGNIDLTHADLRTTGDGGFVTSSSGYDIKLSNNAACSDTIPFERELYTSNGTNGRFIAHFKVSSLAQTSDVYLCWGDSSTTTDQATPTTAWDTGHVMVYHMGAGSTCGLTDTVSGLTLTNTGTVGGTTGQTYGACGSNYSTTVYLERADGATIDAITSAITVSAWVYLTSYADYRIIVCKSHAGDAKRHFCLVSKVTDGHLLGAMATSGPTTIGAESTNAIPLNTWTHVAMTYDGTELKLWINGVGDGTPTAATGAMETTDAAMYVGVFSANGSTFFNPWAGIVDEVRISSTARTSAGWLETEKNAGTPSTFWTVGATTDVGGSGRRRQIIVQ
jgi:hypothetical protein